MHPVKLFMRHKCAKNVMFAFTVFICKKIGAKMSELDGASEVPADCRWCCFHLKLVKTSKVKLAEPADPTKLMGLCL